MAYAREGLATYCQDNLQKTLHDANVRLEPILYVFGINKENMAKLGTPTGGAVFGGAKKMFGSAKMQQISGSKDIQHRYLTSRRDDGGMESDPTESTKTASTFDARNTGTTEFRWSVMSEPAKVEKHALDCAKGKWEVASVMEEATQITNSTAISRFASYLWNGTLTAGQQNGDANKPWPNVLGIKHVMDATTYTTYGRVTRAGVAALTPLSIDSTTALASTDVSLDLGNKINVGFTGQDSTEFVGLYNKGDDMVSQPGVNVCVTTPTLWNDLKSQAEDKGQIVRNGAVDYFESGANFPFFSHDGIVYLFDRRCPSGEAYFFNLDTWLLEIREGGNFQWQDWTAKDQTEEGGGEYLWSRLRVVPRLSCVRPDLNARVTGLTAAD